MLEITNIFDSLGKPHKHIEWTMEQYCLNNAYNFIKQGTSLWLDHMKENTNYNNFTKTILFFWINKTDMYNRLNNRLSNVVQIRYFFPIQRAINSYDEDWKNISKQILLHFFKKWMPLLDETKYLLLLDFDCQKKD